MNSTFVTIIRATFIATVMLFTEAAQSRLDLNLNPLWRFQLGSQSDQPWSANYDDSTWELVSLPHSHQLFSSNLDGFAEHGRTIGWYRRQLIALPCSAKPSR